MLSLFSFDLTYTQVLIVASVALLIGMAKTGINGAGMLAVPLLATVFGGQLSSGIMLPILLLADVMGVWYYHRHASWQHLKILFPWAAVGVVVGTVAGNYINDHVFKIVMAITIVVSVIIMLWLEKMKTPEEIPNKKSFAVATGIAGGFTSMVGNLAGSVMSVYLLSVRLPKNAFIGTTAWFFLVVLIIIANVLAIPLVWYFAESWLKMFAFRTALNPVLFVGTMSIALAATLLVVGAQTLRAAYANPVNSLRSE